MAPLPMSGQRWHASKTSSQPARIKKHATMTRGKRESFILGANYSRLFSLWPAFLDAGRNESKHLAFSLFRYP
jgi:hypothetical protein